MIGLDNIISLSNVDCVLAKSCHNFLRFKNNLAYDKLV